MEPQETTTSPSSPDQMLQDIESALLLYTFAYKTIKKSKAKAGSETKTLKSESAKMIKSIIEALEREQAAYTKQISGASNEANS